MGLYIRGQLYARTKDNYELALYDEIVNNQLGYKIPVAIGAIILLQYLRIFIKFQGSRTFGPLIRTLISMLYQLMLFSLFIIIMLGFIFGGRIAFVEFNQFRSFSSTALFLFDALLGNYKFSVFDNSQFGLGVYGKIYLMAYLIISNIVLLNFLIAILSDTYSHLNEKKQGLYLQQVIYIKQTLIKDENYSSLVFNFAPFNIFLLPVAPFLLMKQRPDLNKFMLHICYIPVLIVGCTSLLIWSLILTPVVYIMQIGIKFWNLFEVKSCRMFCSNFLNFSVYLIGGILYLYYKSFNDIFYFVKSCYKTDQLYANATSSYYDGKYMYMYMYLANDYSPSSLVSIL